MTEGIYVYSDTAIMRLTRERDELARQLEEARRLACHYADLLHLAHDSVGIIERDWKAS